MISFKGTYSLTNLPATWQGKFSANKRYLYGFCFLAVLMAVLELGQDYISSTLNGNYFRLAESLSYKLFWLLFIPFSIIQLYVLKKTGRNFSGTVYFTFNTLFILLITLAHLVIFSLFLFGISDLIHDDSWSLSFLITEKLSTRLYIGLAIYIVFPVIYFLLNQRESGRKQKQQESFNTITVKNGQSTILVDVDNIYWIGSDGAYLYIHTADKKHVVLDSLKNIITTLPDNFRRIHRSTIVNMDVIKELKSRGNGDYDVLLDDNRKLRLSRNYTKPLKGILF